MIGGKLRLLRSQVSLVQKDDRLALPLDLLPSPDAGMFDVLAHDSLLLSRGTNLTHEIAPRSAPRTAMQRSAWKESSANFVLMHIMLGMVALMLALSGTGS